MDTRTVQTSTRWSRLGWFLLLWSAGVLALGGFAIAMRLLMSAAGLSGE